MTTLRLDNQMPCCEDWEEAHKRGTDNESYDVLIGYENGLPVIGSDLPPVRFCPWCGARKP